MTVDFRETALMLFLKRRDSVLYGKAVEVRDVTQNWLAYIPQTFPHYTRHTVLHSEAIVLQISKLLFRGGDATQPVVNLSPMEAYILWAGAHLHDIGMVVSDAEKAHILASAAWHEWVGDGGAGAKRWREIEIFKDGAAPPDPALRNFLADVQLRFLIAEFVRRTHHWRSQALLTENQDRLGRFAFDDPILLRTIGDVCVAHGLDQRELDDRDRYPDRRDILGQQVDVRFLAILLRLGDLLDMSTDRACPLLLNAACPLPPDTLAHWTQYQRLTHFLASPDRIEITALCRNQEEHRIIKDWCGWLTKEISNGAILMSRSARHAGWQAPVATMDCAEATIKIEPDPTASYIPSNWRFELDHDLVFRRLIEDLYTEPLSFIRELIQNALDATRCALYLRLAAEGSAVPNFSTQVPNEVREQYAVSLSLETQDFKNLLSGETEKRQVLVIEDHGIGMDRDVIERYLLQVGRSYYTTVDFQKNFRFVPTSRFGLGFLSVFGASDHVTIETYKPTSVSGPLRLVLTGPRNYILLEKGARRNSGTRIEVRLNEALQARALTGAVSAWCRRVEFPIMVQESGDKVEIRAERKEQFIYEIPDIRNENARFVVRAFDIQRYGLEGELYVFARRDGRSESWDAWPEARYDYPKLDPRASPPVVPDCLTCIQGIRIDHQGASGPRSERLDFRGGDIPVPGLSREHIRILRGRKGEVRDDRITSRWVEILTEHLANCEKAQSTTGWRYKQALVDYFPAPNFWASLPAAIPTHCENELRPVSLNELQRITRVATIIAPQGGFLREDESTPNPEWIEDIPAIFADELRRVSNAHRPKIFRGRVLESAYWLPTGHLVIHWRVKDGSEPFGGPVYRPSYLAELPDSFTVGFEIHSTEDSAALGSILLNAKNPFVQWLISVKEAVNDRASGISLETFQRLYEMFCESCAVFYHAKTLSDYVDKWRETMSDRPANLRPPHSQLSAEMFRRASSPAEFEG